MLVQASVYSMPFRKTSFSRVFCFGVMQHTPNPQKTFESIVEMLVPGGAIASDIYVKDLFH
jgi:2-polyprenyl-3-methyl-5-hydroxy-6-metoxy-1,4-benzoquinol methylase